ncbi:MAG: hypothetical protein JW940_25220 [Polyangiaceae bacterium]|nr:hypothetical protein [Polyangiaceae bacterium]
MSQPAPQQTASEDRLARFRRLRGQLAPARDPSEVLVQGGYVERPDSVGRRIAAELELAPASSHVLIGGVGSGKTTELLVVDLILDAVDDTEALFVDVSRRHDIGRMKPGVVLAQVGLALTEWMDASTPGQQSRMAKSAADTLRALALGYIDPPWDPEPDYDETPGILDPPEQLDDAVQPFANCIRTLLGELSDLRPHFVVLLDGLDRMIDVSKFEEIVRQDIKALLSLGIGIVLVGPLRALYGVNKVLLEFFERSYYQPWLDVERDEGARQLLRSMLTQRVEPTVFEEKAIDRLVGSSGGVARDLFALAQSACLEAYLQGIDQIGVSQVEASVDAFGRKHMQGLRPEEIEVLQRVRTRREFVHTSESDLGLLMTRRVLEYRDRNQQPRYVVHPTIARFLKAMEP